MHITAHRQGKTHINTTSVVHFSHHAVECHNERLTSANQQYAESIENVNAKHESVCVNCDVGRGVSPYNNQYVWVSILEKFSDIVLEGNRVHKSHSDDSHRPSLDAKEPFQSRTETNEYIPRCFKCMALKFERKSSEKHKWRHTHHTHSHLAVISEVVTLQLPPSNQLYYSVQHNKMITKHETQYPLKQYKTLTRSSKSQFLDCFYS